ncbi:unnamed protein product [Fusarium graminearum]|uniref:F-box domain-containing protein n=1 Tax=Gibberella zeae (strain ATCC MYA-4620 / CBS 123657 / FGSC 9075 / NRRL 31084 / PH-1) TaxID=229533 RepID=I1RFR5_GIBZE|nr:hypothetical protein FGSG_02552 [Fusarium graminearum PH-1]EYB31719.1 hypothetical protein FG05_02552 [Fusarium graminearum]ESU08004.1 hypothetical protein FGSG_02552 [Fusarium graminearum PH-1]PCD36337.1 hypothetical protein FGRA07_08221 [Fusarium graminearum]CAF3453720.1 unnamed protein product [Fusarium graminearum]CAG1961292.1 unnamed protein product [Fusarium graminearum]|eukprot:XP_011318489.1 hypothetical protein FGSG_02552 [Fusarium graminearum PH-1]
MVVLWNLSEGIQQCIADTLFGSNKRPPTTKLTALAKHRPRAKFNLLDLPNELIYAVGVAAERRDARALSTTCRRLRENLASIVWSRVKLSIGLCVTSSDIDTFVAYLEEHCEKFGLIKEATIHFDGCRTECPPCCVDELLSVPKAAYIINAMTSLESLSLDVQNLSAKQIKTLTDELRSGPNIEVLELKCEKNSRCLMECVGEATGPGSSQSIAAPEISSHLGSQSTRATISRPKHKSTNDCGINYIAERFPQLKSLVIREPLFDGYQLTNSHFTADKIPQIDGMMLGTALKEKLPTLQRFVCTIHFANPIDLVPHLSRFRPLISMAAANHPALNEMVIILSRMYLICWKRESNHISLRECYGPWLFRSMPIFEQTVLESLLLNTVPLEPAE